LIEIFADGVGNNAMRQNNILCQSVTLRV